MPVQLDFTSNPIRQQDPGLGQQFEQVVAEALNAHPEAAGPGPVQVRFSVWAGESTPRYVCKVECANGCTLDPHVPAWRWWSGLVETPHELGQELRDAARARGRSGRPAAPEAASVERWGWAGELTLS
jgi:hypothetical protein